MVGIHIIGDTRDMSYTAAQRLVGEAAVLKKPGSGGKLWGGLTHVRTITDAMGHTTLDSNSQGLTLVWKN